MSWLSKSLADLGGCSEVRSFPPFWILRPPHLLDRLVADDKRFRMVSTVGVVDSSKQTLRRFRGLQLFATWVDGVVVGDCLRIDLADRRLDLASHSFELDFGAHTDLDLGCPDRGAENTGYSKRRSDNVVERMMTENGCLN